MGVGKSALNNNQLIVFDTVVIVFVCVCECCSMCQLSFSVQTHWQVGHGLRVIVLKHINSTFWQTDSTAAVSRRNSIQLNIPHTHTHTHTIESLILLDSWELLTISAPALTFCTKKLFCIHEACCSLSVNVTKKRCRPGVHLYAVVSVGVSEVERWKFLHWFILFMSHAATAFCRGS